MKRDGGLVSVVVPARDSAATLGKCLDACLDQDYPHLEVIVVDDGSQDATAAVAARYPVRLIRQANAGPAAARNRGWRAAQGEIVCFTDADCVPARDWVRSLLAGYHSHEVAGVGGSYDIANPGSFLAHLIHAEIRYRHSRMPRLVDYLGGFNLSYRRRILEEVGGFDESYPAPSAEDNELSYRVIKAGYRLVFTPRARVAHHHPERIFPYLRSQFRHGYWRVKLYRDHPDMARGDAYAGVLDLLQPPLALLGLAGLPLLLLPSGWWVSLLAWGLLLGMEIVQSLTMAWGRKEPRLLCWWLMAFPRSLARGLGMLAGLARFGLRAGRNLPCAG